MSIQTGPVIALLRIGRSMTRRIPHVAAAYIFFGLPLAGSAAAGVQKPTYLKSDDLTTPIGLDTPQPQFSWQLQDDRFCAEQTAYQVEVATRPDLLIGDKADVWDSGRIVSDKSVGVVYEGTSLKSEQRYYWRVKVWDKDGNEYPPSDVLSTGP
ncbi:MAG: hypothetical protein JOZ33_05650 [Acidobacteriaceae bacterium]|nr:hypothetical protein [Acidobacteriaceae bacterium]